MLAASLVLFGACIDPSVRLRRGTLGPASYRMELGVGGDPTVRSLEHARLVVSPHQSGVTLRLTIEDDDPIVADLVRTPSGKLALDTVQGITPPAAGEQELAAIVSQLDPPLPRGRVSLGGTWTRTRRIETASLDATITSRLRFVRLRRVGGHDAAEIEGTVRGRLLTRGQAGAFEGRVSGRTTIAWAIAPGRLAASDTTLAWTIPDVGRIVVRTKVEPA